MRARLRLLDHGASEITGPAFSPDGTRVAFKKRTGPGRWRLAVLNLEGIFTRYEDAEDMLGFLRYASAEVKPLAQALRYAAENADVATRLAKDRKRVEVTSAFAAGWLVVRAIRKRQRAKTGCGSADEGCGCTSLKKNLKR